MKTNKKVMTGALLLFMMMAANFHNAINDYGIRSNAFMNGVIASGSAGTAEGGYGYGPNCCLVEETCKLWIIDGEISLTPGIGGEYIPGAKKLCNKSTAEKPCSPGSACYVDNETVCHSVL